MIDEDPEKNEGEWTTGRLRGGGGKKDGIPGSRRRMQTYILTYLGVILTYSGFKERPFDSSGSSADGILNSTSAVPQRSIETVNK